MPGRALPPSPLCPAPRWLTYAKPFLCPPWLLPGPDQIPVPTRPPVPALTALRSQLLHDPTPHTYTYLPPSTHLCSAASTQLTLPLGARCTPHSAGTTALHYLLRGPALPVITDEGGRAHPRLLSGFYCPPADL